MNRHDSKNSQQPASPSNGKNKKKESAQTKESLNLQPSFSPSHTLSLKVPFASY